MHAQSKLSAVSTGGANVGELRPLDSSVGGVEGREWYVLDSLDEVVAAVTTGGASSKYKEM